jgi:Rod binding domain-containing protein
MQDIKFMHQGGVVVQNNKIINQSSINKAAVGFEENFVKLLLDSSVKTMPGDGLFGDNKQRETMIDMQNQLLAKHLASSKSFGFADLIINQSK